MNRKHNKYSQEWLNEIKRLVPKKNTTEKDKDNKIIDKPEIEVLGEKRVELESQITTLNEEIGTGKKSNKKAKDAYKAYKYLERRIAHIEDTANKTDFSNRSSYFRNNVTNTYGGGEGWNKLVKDHFEKDIATGTAYTDNIYDIQFPNETNKREVVEEEIITVLGRVFEGLENIDVGKLTTKYKDFDNNATNQGNVKTWLENIQKEAKCLVKSKDGKMYDFGYTYRQHKGLGNAGDGALKNDGATAPTNVRPVRALLVEFFNWLDLVNKENFLKTLTDDINTSQNISIRLKGNEISKAFLKDDYGITLKDNQKLYWNGTATTNYHLQGGVKGWIALAGLVGTTGNRVKILESFNDTPNHDLFDNMMRAGNAWNENQKSWNYDGTRFASLEDMTDDNSINKGKETLDELAVQKDLEVQDVALSNREIAKKQTEKGLKETERNNLDTKIQKLITDELATRRTELTNIYKIADGFEDKTSETDGKDNRRSISDLRTIKTKLEDIRFLENADDEQVTTDAENTAHDKVNQLVNDFNASKMFGFIIVEGATDADKCKKIKENSQDLESYKTDYEKWEKLIKFTDKQQAEFNAIKIALGQKEDPTDTLATYQTKLKTLDPSLDETIITQSLIDDWKTQTNFKTADTMENLIKKVWSDGKLNDNFKAAMIKQNAELTDLAQLFKKKKAKEIITLIKRWEYDSDTTANRDKTGKIIRMNMSKTKSDTLSDEQITTGLYKLAVGEYSQKTEAEIKKWEGGGAENNQNSKKNFFQDFFRVNNPWMWGGISVIAVAAIAAFYYFYQKAQGGEKTEEELAGGNEVEREEEDEKE